MKHFLIILATIWLTFNSVCATAKIAPDVLYKSLELTAESIVTEQDTHRATIAFVEYYPAYNINRYLVFTKTTEKYIYCQQRTVEWVGKDVHHTLTIGERVYYIEYSQRVLTYCWVDSNRYENPIV